jgi:hypothetical protein
MNKSEYGSDFCRAHGGQSKENAECVRGFLLAKAEDRARLAEVADELEPVKELREAISLQHMLIERRFNLIQNETDLLAACGPLNAMLQTMERLVASCHKIEQNLGELLARHAVLTLAKKMVEIVIDELEGVEEYELIVDRITERLIDTIRGANNQEQTVAVAMLPPPGDRAAG